ncbi:MAG TPA: PIN domain-containing protein [Caulobacterales bacterium]|nr:PIN domain-containing protein [Caulobacterales bacterium]
MTARILVDANVVIYSLDGRAPQKQQRCAAWLSALTTVNSLIVSPQVCNEVFVVAQRKIPAPASELRAAIEGLLIYCDAPLTAVETRRALALEARWRLHWWDAVLLASAISAGCTHLLSEDAQSSPIIEGVQIIDPFQVAPEAVLGAT